MARNDKSIPHRSPPSSPHIVLASFPRIVLASRCLLARSPLSIVLFLVSSPVLLLRLVFVSSSFPSVSSSYLPSLIPVGSSNRLISSHRCRSPLSLYCPISPHCVLRSLLRSYQYRPYHHHHDWENELNKTARPSYRRTARPSRPRHRTIGSHDGATGVEHAATR